MGNSSLAATNSVGEVQSSSLLRYKQLHCYYSAFDNSDFTREHAAQEQKSEEQRCQEHTDSKPADNQEPVIVHLWCKKTRRQLFVPSAEWQPVDVAPLELKTPNLARAR
eukprot:2533153-Amphidinium_carterae.1